MLPQLVDDAALHFREILASKNIRLVRRLDERTVVRAGRGMLELVVQNVLANASSFSPYGGTAVVAPPRSEEMAALDIHDDAIG